MMVNIVMAHIVEDIRSWVNLFTTINFVVAPQESNTVADKLAKSAHSQIVTSNILFSSNMDKEVFIWRLCKHVLCYKIDVKKTIKVEFMNL